MDMTAFFTMSYGLYVVSAQAEGERAGCLIKYGSPSSCSPDAIAILFAR